MADFIMPKLGADMTAGTLVAWKKMPGDAVRRGEIIAEVETDKGVIEVEVFHTGIVEKLLAQPGDHVPVGTALATVRVEGETPAVAATAAPTPRVPTVAAVPASMPSVPIQPAAETTRLRISPSARALARQLGVDPSHVKGTGREGAITREDIERAAAAKKPKAAKPAPTSPRATTVKPLEGMRLAIAGAMSRSKREIPHYYLGTTIDMHRALTWLEEQNVKRAVTERLLPAILLIKATALAVKSVPELNAFWTDAGIDIRDAIHVGVAIALRKGGLIAPALHDTDKHSLEELMKTFLDLVARTRTGSLRGSELSDPTITVTSLGDQGVETVYPIIIPPQTAIVGFGKIALRPWVVDGQVVARRVVHATLSADHRVSDGHRGGLFLATLDRLLQEPEKL